MKCPTRQEQGFSEWWTHNGKRFVSVTTIKVATQVAFHDAWMQCYAEMVDDIAVTAAETAREVCAMLVCGACAEKVPRLGNGIIHRNDDGVTYECLAAALWLATTAELRGPKP